MQRITVSRKASLTALTALEGRPLAGGPEWGLTGGWDHPDDVARSCGDPEQREMAERDRRPGSETRASGKDGRLNNSALVLVCFPSPAKGHSAVIKTH